MVGTLAITLATGPAQKTDSRVVRETEALSAEEERAKLHVPEGFEVQLFASEPMINKRIAHSPLAVSRSSEGAASAAASTHDDDN